MKNEPKVVALRAHSTAEEEFRCWAADRLESHGVKAAFLFAWRAGFAAGVASATEAEISAFEREQERTGPAGNPFDGIACLTSRSFYE